MEVKNAVIPNEAQIKGFMEPGHDGPIYMLNLLKFKEKAVYEDGRACDLTGSEAYQRYARAFREIMEPRGVRILYSGEVRGALIGAGDDLWDAVALIEYPSTEVMLTMLRDEEYQQAQQHRAAGLEGQLLIECGPGFTF